MSFASASGATSSHDAASGGLSDSAPTSKYTARRVKVADLRMRSASPLVENVGAPSASTVCSSMLSRVMPSANRSRGAEAAAETSPSSPSSRRWIRCTVTSRFPRMVSSIPAKYPSPLPDVDAADCAATASFAAGTDISASPPASHAVSPASTSSRVSSARAAFVRASAAAGSSSPFRPPASPASANPATTCTSSMSTITGDFPSARQGTRRVSLPTAPLRTRKGESQRVQRLHLEPHVREDHVAFEHRDFQVIRADAVHVRPEHLVQHSRELRLEHRAGKMPGTTLKGSMCRPELALLPFPYEICQRGGVDARARVARTGARASFFGAITYLPPRVASVLDAARAA